DIDGERHQGCEVHGQQVEPGGARQQDSDGRPRQYHDREPEGRVHARPAGGVSTFLRIANQIRRGSGPRWTWRVIAGAHFGTGTRSTTPSSTASVVAPSISTSGRSTTRCRHAGFTSAFTSSGVT